VYLDPPEGVSEASISPDGRWAAFTSNEQGTGQVFVRPFPSAESGPQVKISIAGGMRAHWSGDGRTIYYQSATLDTIRAAHVNPGPPFTVTAREDVLALPGLGAAWDVDRRTGRLILTQSIKSGDERIIVVMHWLEQFRHSAAATR
jgi:serine/threonine-protein kinase